MQWLFCKFWVLNCSCGQETSTKPPETCQRDKVGRIDRDESCSSRKKDQFSIITGCDYERLESIDLQSKPFSSSSHFLRWWMHDLHWRYSWWSARWSRPGSESHSISGRTGTGPTFSRLECLAAQSWASAAHPTNEMEWCEQEMRSMY